METKKKQDAWSPASSKRLLLNKRKTTTMRCTKNHIVDPKWKQTRRLFTTSTGRKILQQLQLRNILNLDQRTPKQVRSKQRGREKGNVKRVCSIEAWVALGRWETSVPRHFFNKNEAAENEA